MRPRRDGLGVAPLSALDAPPDRFIRAAADAGFTAVGLRLSGVTEGDPVVDTDLGSRGFAAVRRALDDTGTTLLDIEVLSVTRDLARDDWLRVMGAGEALGATILNLVGVEPDRSALVDIVGRITADAHEHGLEPVLEPVAYRALDSFPDAFGIARDVGCSVELDALHFLRTGARVETIRESADLVPIVQLCDAPERVTDHGASLAEIAGGTSPTELEIAESRGRRLLPGDGVVPLRALLEAVGPETAVSVEIPNDLVRGGAPVAEHLARLHRAATDFLRLEGN